jgi:hypothetical protein
MCYFISFFSPKFYANLLLNTQQLIVFTESSDTYKELDAQLTNSPILNCAKFNNAELQDNL